MKKTLDYYNKVNNEVKKYNNYNIRNPFIDGIKSLIEDKMIIQGYLDRIVTISNDFEKLHNEKQLEVKNKEVKYRFLFEKLLCEDEEVRKQKSEALRTAAANCKILKEFEEYNTANNDLMVIKNLRDIINSIKDNLNSKLRTSICISKDCHLAVAAGELQLKINLDETSQKIRMKLKSG